MLINIKIIQDKILVISDKINIPKMLIRKTEFLTNWE